MFHDICAGRQNRCANPSAPIELKSRACRARRRVALVGRFSIASEQLDGHCRPVEPVRRGPLQLGPSQQRSRLAPWQMK